jgi:hypothetical protein
VRKNGQTALVIRSRQSNTSSSYGYRSHFKVKSKLKIDAAESEKNLRCEQRIGMSTKLKNVEGVGPGR